MSKLVLAVLLVLVSQRPPSAGPYPALQAITALQQQTLVASQGGRLPPAAFRSVLYATSGAARAITSAMSTNLSGAIYEAKQESLQTIRASHADWTLDQMDRSGLRAAFLAAETALAVP